MKLNLVKKLVKIFKHFIHYLQKNQVEFRFWISDHFRSTTFNEMLICQI